jgi:hypothetical protein
MKKRSLTFLLAIHICFIPTINAQTKYDSINAHYNCIEGIDSLDGLPIYTITSKLPEYPGGIEKLYEFLTENVKYPKIDSIEEIQFTIRVSFIVDTAGNCVNFCVINRRYPDKLTVFELECLRTYASMPKWIPGEAHGRKVPVSFIIPARFEYEIDK